MDNNQLITLIARYSLLRAEANENGSVINLSAGEGDFASKPSAAVKIPTYQNKTEANGIEIIFAGADADGDTFSWKLWAWRHGNGMATLICDGTGAIGTQDVVKYPDSDLPAANRWYADILALINNEFPMKWKVADIGGNGRVAKLYGDLLGYEWIYLEITDADGSGTEAESVSSYFSYL